MIGELFCYIARILNKCQVDKLPLTPAGTIDINLASSILLDKLEEMGCKAEIYLPDMDINVYNKEEVKASYELQEVSSLKYTLVHNCDDFAAKLYGKFAGLVWTNVHALNYFISNEGIFYFIEPQTGKLSRTLEDWQGNEIRFLLGR